MKKNKNFFENAIRESAKIINATVRFMDFMAIERDFMASPDLSDDDKKELKSMIEENLVWRG